MLCTFTHNPLKVKPTDFSATWGDFEGENRPKTIKFTDGLSLGRLSRPSRAMCCQNKTAFEAARIYLLIFQIYKSSQDG